MKIHIFIIYLYLNEINEALILKVSIDSILIW